MPQELTAVASETVGRQVAHRAGARTCRPCSPRAGSSAMASRARCSRARVTRRAHHTALGGDQMVGRRRAVRDGDGAARRRNRYPRPRRHGLLPRGGGRRVKPVFAATGDDVHAWVEVEFDGGGWVPFNPTRPEDQVPNDQTTKPAGRPRARRFSSRRLRRRSRWTCLRPCPTTASPRTRAVDLAAHHPHDRRDRRHVARVISRC